MMRLTPLVATTSAVSLLTILLGEGWEIGRGPAAQIAIYALGFLAVLLSLGLTVREFERPRRLREFRSLLAEVLLLVPVVAFVGRPSLWGLVVFVRQSWVLTRLLARTTRYQRLMTALLADPAKVMVFSFALVIFVGAVLLTFPRATTDGQGAAFIDALFTSTSATCVTGLATLNTVADAFANPELQSFSAFGQAVILVLAQIGGLGIMTISTATIVLAGGRLGLRGTGLMQSLIDEESTAALRSAVRQILVMTFTIELAGAAMLFIRFDDGGVETSTALWRATFISISAFCNAGFSVFGDSLSSFVGDPWINLTVAGLITLGGLGFSTIVALTARRTWRTGPVAGWRRLPLHPRIVVVMSLALTTLGGVAWYFFDYDHSLKALTVDDKVLASFFQSVSLRTAGFNTVDISAISRATLLIAVALMFIGASPGSTGGGVKTTTIAVLLMSIRASLRNQSSLEVGRRTISPAVVNRAVSIVAITLLVIVLGLVLLVATQPHLPFDRLLFEAVSAIGTVGLSMNTTPLLDDVGKSIVIVLMFIGRVGPLTIALAVGRRQAVDRVRYPEGRVIVG